MANPLQQVSDFWNSMYKGGWGGGLDQARKMAQFHGYHGPTWTQFYGSSMFQNKVTNAHKQIAAQNYPHTVKVLIPYVRID